jgi:putative addiction module killer protein
MGYSSGVEIIQSNTFKDWFASLRDRQAKARISARIRRASLGNLGDMKSIREGLLEMRIDYGPGYRLYCIRKGQIIIVLLSGGDKRSQSADIEKALTLAKEWRD